MTGKTTSFEAWSWFRFNNLELALAMVLKFYTSMAKGLKLEVRKFWELIPMFVEVTGEKLEGGPFCLSAIQNRVDGHEISQVPAANIYLFKVNNGNT